MISGIGWLDITDMGVPPGQQANLVRVAGQPYWSSGEASMSLAITQDGACVVTGDGNNLQVELTPLPQVSSADLGILYDMVTEGLVPYQDLPPDGRPFEVVADIAANMFAWSPDALSLGLAVYDWTTADFFRMQIFDFYRYTSLPGQPLDQDDIVTAIWTADWPPYTHTDAAFMGSMLMTPCDQESAVATQYQNVADTLSAYLAALKRITTAAVMAMPRTCVLPVPALYSGQVDIANLGEDAFATYFEEYPGNAGPPPAPMGMPLADALQSFLGPGNTVTLKSFLSTTDTQADAAKYSNGILLEIAPDPSRSEWSNAAYITALSDEADKTEYLFVPGSRFAMGNSSQQTIGGRLLTVIQMTEIPSG